MVAAAAGAVAFAYVACVARATCADVDAPAHVCVHAHASPLWA